MVSHHHHILAVCFADINYVTSCVPKIKNPNIFLKKEKILGFFVKG
jgi:hypothetical protein